MLIKLGHYSERAGQDDKVLGQQTELGRFFTNFVIAIGVTGSIWAIAFNHLP